MRNNIFFGVISIIVMILVILCSAHPFSDPLDELTRGCTTDDSYSKDYEGRKEWRYYCQNKPWHYVEKTLRKNGKYYDYNVYLINVNDGRDEIGSYIWNRGNYECTMYGAYVIRHNGGWYYRNKPIKYKGYCSKQEFIYKLKENLKSDEWESINVDWREYFGHRLD